MRGEHIFVDTNILLYAYDSSAKKKRELAMEKIAALWERPYPPAVSIQVLQEFFVNLLRFNVSPVKARSIVGDLFVWEVIDNNRKLVTRAWDIQSRWKLSFWDALIVAAAQEAKADIIWSEDLQGGQSFDGIRVVNPLIN